MRRAPTVLVLSALVLAGACSGSDDGAGSETTEAEETSTTADDAAPDTTEASEPDADDPDAGDPDTGSSLPEGATEGLDDVDGDGEPDPTCGTVDHGGGLVLRRLCTPLSPDQEEGVVPVTDSLLLVPSVSLDEIAEVDATARRARDADGNLVTIYLLGSDTLFDSGSSAVRSTADPALAGVIASIQADAPGSPVQVRGHADSTGSASANQALSEERAAAVAAWLGANGLDASTIEAVGLGSTVPVSEETTEVGAQVNRRIEIVVRT